VDAQDDPPEPGALALISPHADGPVLGGELDGVGEEVDEAPEDFLGVQGHEKAQPWVGFAQEGDLLLLREVVDGDEGVVQQLVDRDRDEGELTATGLQPGEVQEVVDEQGESLRVAKGGGREFLLHVVQGPGGLVVRSLR
jgi:hypothetical protein